MKLSFQNLVHIYHSPAGDARQVLAIPAWDIAEGEQVLLRGVSGSGKTTLFNITAGLLRPTRGDVYYDTQGLYALHEAERDQFRARTIGYVFQSHYLIRTLTAQQNVVMPLAFGGSLPSQDWNSRAAQLLDALGLAGFGADYPATLSTGQRMRVAVARALANRPRVLLADEPTAALDTDSANVVMDVIQQTCQADGVTLLVASHDPALRARFRQSAYLNAGQLTLEAYEPA